MASSSSSSSYLPVTCLARMEPTEPGRSQTMVQQRLELLGAVDEGPLKLEAQLLHGTATGQKSKWLQLDYSDVPGMMLYDYVVGSPLFGTVEGVHNALVASGLQSSRPIALGVGRLFSLDGWRIGVALLSASAAPSRLPSLILIMQCCSHRSRAHAPLELFSAMCARLVGEKAAQGCHYAHHDATPPGPTMATTSGQYNKAHLCVAWVTLLQPEIKMLSQPRKQ